MLLKKYVNNSIYLRLNNLNHIVIGMNLCNWIDVNIDKLKAEDFFLSYFDESQIEDIEGFKYLINKLRGISLTLSSTLQVDAIQLYSFQFDGFNQFDGGLPYEIHFAMSRAEVRLRLGFPQRVGGGEINYFIGMVPNWDKFIFDHYTLHFKYSHDLNSILLITIGPLELDQ